MLPDPINLKGLLGESTLLPLTGVPFHVIQNGPGAKSIRTARNVSALNDLVGWVGIGSLAALTGLTLTTSHEVVRGGRRRSLLRFDLESRAIGDGTKSNSAAYLVIDRDPSAAASDESAFALLALILGFLKENDQSYELAQFGDDPNVLAFVAGEP